MCIPLERRIGSRFVMFLIVQAATVWSLARIGAQIGVDRINASISKTL